MQSSSGSNSPRGPKGSGRSSEDSWSSGEDIGKEAASGASKGPRVGGDSSEWSTDSSDWSSTVSTVTGGKSIGGRVVSSPGKRLDTTVADILLGEREVIGDRQEAVEGVLRKVFGLAELVQADESELAEEEAVDDAADKAEDPGDDDSDVIGELPVEGAAKLEMVFEVFENIAKILSTGEKIDLSEDVLGPRADGLLVHLKDSLSREDLDAEAVDMRNKMLYYILQFSSVLSVDQRVKLLLGGEMNTDGIKSVAKVLGMLFLSSQKVQVMEYIVARLEYKKRQNPGLIKALKPVIFNFITTGEGAYKFPIGKKDKKACLAHVFIPRLINLFTEIEDLQEIGLNFKIKKLLKLKRPGPGFELVNAKTAVRKALVGLDEETDEKRIAFNGGLLMQKRSGRGK